jgi:hypothetical protein
MKWNYLAQKGLIWILVWMILPDPVMSLMSGILSLSLFQ